MLLFFFLLFALLFFTLLLVYWIAWISTSEQKLEEIVKFKFVTIIIPARNEEKNIGRCIESIKKQNYPAGFYEVIIIDDHSVDKTWSIILNNETDNIHGIQLDQVIDQNKVNNSYKKAALEYAIGKAKGELILTTDADCMYQPNWIHSFVQHFNNYPKLHLVTGPVVFNNDKNWFTAFQSLDFIGMMMATLAAAKYGIGSMANGANLMYRKTTFTALNGFAENNNLASGDDMFFIEKVKKTYGKQAITFLKSKHAIVETPAPESIQEFIQQRIRWGSKTTAYKEKTLKFILLSVYLFHIGLLVIPILMLFFNSINGLYFWIIVGFKFIVDFIYLSTGAKFFGRLYLLKFFLSSEILHFVYILAVGLLANMQTYQWKGRTVK